MSVDIKAIDAETPASDTLDASHVLNQRLLHDLCWEFEEALRSGKSPRIEDWLDRRGVLSRELLLSELLMIEYELRSSPPSSIAHEPFNSNASLSVETKSTHDDQTLASFLASVQLRFPSDAKIVDAVVAELSAERMKRSCPLPFSKTDRRYQFIHEIARGGTSAVWRVYDRHLHRESAVKVLLDSHNNMEMRRRLEREARLCGRLQHPGIVPIHELDHFDDGLPFVSMKLVEGKSLAELLGSNDPPDTVTLLRIFQDACEAIAHAHEQGIVHRDLKPQNIMVGAFNEVQVMDWGLGKDLTDKESLDCDSDVPRSTPDCADTLVGTVFGTLAYMSPEQANGEVDRVGRSSDVFSLGCILCRILTGRPVYDGTNQNELLAQAQSGKTADALSRLQACKVDRRLRQLACQCISASAVERPKDAREVSNRLRLIVTPHNRVRNLAVAALAVSIGILVFDLTAKSLINSDRLNAKLLDASSPNTVDSLSPEIYSDKFTIEERLNSANVHLQQKAYSESERLLRSVLDNDPNNGQAYFVLIDVLVESGHAADAASVARDLWKRFPHNKEALNRYLEFLFRETESPPGFETWQQALLLHPSEVPLRYEIAWKLLLQDLLTDSERVYRESIELDPNFYVGYYGLAAVLHRQGRFSEAVENATRATERSVRDPKWHEDCQRFLDVCVRSESEKPVE